MLLWLTEYLSQCVSGFSVFQYLVRREIVGFRIITLVPVLVGLSTLKLR